MLRRSADADGQQYLPWRIKISLIVRDERGVEVPYVTEAHTMLAGTRIPPPQLDEFFLLSDAPRRDEELRKMGVEPV